ncbi:META domain-containing protein [Arthrobacter sp. 18067]|uniref:META domain-containing protein n=1 Tax=Arthrobacter sp. 18067 TaxID=2681413 RepID=UPI00135835C4|nr:META domain-containing protein [Arthrobacter sp. 18067]
MQRIRLRFLLGASIFCADATGDVAWLGTVSLRVSSRHANGEWTIFVRTPCNHLQVAVSVQDDVLSQLWMAATEKGCEEPTGSYQAYTEKLFEQPVQWKLDGDTLTLHNSHATVELKES